MTALLLLAFACLAWPLLMRVSELFFVSIREGEILLVRGRLPPSLHEELADVVRRAQVSRGSVRAVVAEGAPRLVARELAPGVEQQLRNVLGQYSLRQLRHARPPKSKNLGQALGVAALAWRLERGKR